MIPKIIIAKLVNKCNLNIVIQITETKYYIENGDFFINLL
jgi:hypothetical protein